MDPTVLDIKNQTAVPSGGLQGPQGWNFGVITTATEMGLGGGRGPLAENRQILERNLLARPTLDMYLPLSKF